MTRVRTDNVFGTTTDNPLLVGATTMNSAGLANLAAVSSAEAFITLDPNRVAGAPEIVVVTAHTGSATSATIQRGQFGTTARQHASGTAWVHGPIAANATTYATAADDQGDFVPMNVWEAWVPTTTGITIGAGTIVAVFVRQGRTIHYSIIVTLGAGSAITGNVSFTLPVAASANVTAAEAVMGVAKLQDTGTAGYHGLAVKGTTTSIINVYVGTAAAAYVADAALSSTVPHTWASTDVISVKGTYEAAT